MSMMARMGAVALVGLITACTEQAPPEQAPVVDKSTTAPASDDSNNYVEKAKQKGSELYDATVDKSKALYEAAKEKTSESYDASADAARSAYESTKEEAARIGTAVVDSSKEAYESAKSKGSEMIDQAKERLDQ